jgi:hypothetical protein
MASPATEHMDQSMAWHIVWFSPSVTNDIGRSAFDARMQKK